MTIIEPGVFFLPGSFFFIYASSILKYLSIISGFAVAFGAFVDSAYI